MVKEDMIGIPFIICRFGFVVLLLMKFQITITKKKNHMKMLPNLVQKQ